MKLTRYNKTCMVSLMALLLAMAPITIMSQILRPRLSLCGGKQYTYQIQLANNIKQTIYGSNLNNSTRYMANVNFAVEKPSLDSLINVTAFFNGMNYAFQLRGRDTAVSIPGKTGGLKRYSYLPFGRILQRGVMENDPLGSTLDLENNLLPFRLFCEMPSNGVEVVGQWTSQQVDTIYSVGLGGKLAILSQTNYSFTSTTIIQNKAYAMITYQMQLNINGANNMDGALINTLGKGTGTGEMLLDTENGVLYSDQNTISFSVVKATSGNTVMNIPISQQVVYKIQRIN